METQIRTGLNRTGVGMSPIAIKKMLKDNDALAPVDAAEPLGVSPIRERYIIESTYIGTVPVPATLKGVLETGKAAFTGEKAQVLIDKMGERLAFERGGVRLYEALLSKCSALPDALPGATVEQLTHFREEEADHFEMLRESMLELGADPTAQTPSADITGIESSGLFQVIGDPRTSLLQSLHAVLTAELVDQVAWEELITLAEQFNYRQFASQCRRALEQENNHLATIRSLVSDLTLAEAKQF